MAKHMTYLQFKKTADQLASTQKSVTPKDLFYLVKEISTQEQVNEYYQRWLAESSAMQASAHVTQANDTAELKKALSITRATLESTEDGILIINNEGKITDFNQKFLEIVEVPKEIIESGEENDGLGYLLTLLENPEELIAQMQYLMQHPNETGDMGEVRFKNGKIVERYSQPHRIGEEIVGRVWSFRDVTQKRRQEDQLRLSNRAIEASTHGVVLVENSRNFPVIALNPASLNLLAIKEKDTLNKNFFEIFDGFKNHAEQLKHIFETASKGKEIIHFNLDNQLKWYELSIDPILDKTGKSISHFVVIINDVTQNKELESLLKYKAVHDSLTGLPNKNYFEDKVKYRIREARDKKFAVLFIDIDRFKNINDTLGHNAGDKLLKLFGTRIQSLLRKEDIIARIGGDEFLILINQATDPTELNNIIDRILKSCRKEFTKDGHEFNISASIGVTAYPDAGQDPETLIRNADIAMYKAKETGRDRVCFYTSSLDQTMSRRLEIENSLHTALKKQEFELYFQPIYSIKEKCFCKAEALIRWNHPKLGFIPPYEFIQIAEDGGLMPAIGYWILESSFKEINTCKKLGLNMSLSINISVKQLMEENFAQRLSEMIKDAKIENDNIILEVTENFFLLEGAVLKTVNSLHQLGLRLSIDDFGTGYSNLSYLNQLDISYLKIDKSFVDQIEIDETNTPVLLAIISIGKQLGYQIIAEGVETKKQLDFLIKHGCDQIQGYYFSKPLPAKAFETFILDKTC